jgi:hypothetical protein
VSDRHRERALMAVLDEDAADDVENAFAADENIIDVDATADDIETAPVATQSIHLPCCCSEPLTHAQVINCGNCLMLAAVKP